MFISSVCVYVVETPVATIVDRKKILTGHESQKSSTLLNNIIEIVSEKQIFRRERLG